LRIIVKQDWNFSKHSTISWFMQLQK